MKRGGRAVRERAERAAIVRILSTEPVLCGDCGSARFRVTHDGQRCTITVFHQATCPCTRSAWSARSCDDSLRAVLIMNGLALADYLDVTAAHR